MGQMLNNLKTFFGTDKGFKPLLLITLLCLFVSPLLLHKEVNSIEEWQKALTAKSFQDNLPQELSQLAKSQESPLHLAKTLKGHYCGVLDHLLLILRFNHSGQLALWIKHVTDKSFDFPPQTKPQQYSRFFIEGERLHWSFNIHGKPMSFKTPLNLNLKTGQKIPFFKEGDTFFSQEACHSLKNL